MTTNAQAMKMLETAKEMERKGKAFYEKAIVACSNALGREIFTTLRDDEIIHLERIQRISESLAGGAWNDDWVAAGEGHADLGPFFQDLARKAGSNIKAEASDLEALDVGIGFEQQSVTFYTQELARATAPLERQFLERMIAEEKGHFTVLTDMKFYLSNPAAYFAERERAGFDGA